MKQIIRLTESDLHNIVNEAVNIILTEERIDEINWKNLAMTGAIGAASLFGSPQAAQAQGIQQNNHQTQAVERFNRPFQRANSIRQKADEFFMRQYGNTKIDWNSQPQCQREVKYLISTCRKDFKHPVTGELLSSLLTRMNITDGSDAGTEMMNHILFRNPKTGKYITADNPTYEDMMYIDAYFTCENKDAFDGDRDNVIIVNIGGVNYFVNLGNFLDYDW